MSSSTLRNQDHLGHGFFVLTIFAAIAVHLLAVGIWTLMPKTQIIDIPVRTLNVKLGDGNEAIEMTAPQPEITNKNDVENTISRLVRDETPEQTMRTQSVISSIDKAVNTDKPKAEKAPKQYVRNSNQVAKTGGSTLGNSDRHDAQMMARYEQLISLWIQKFKLYPDEARAQSMQGETVLRIRIDRHGNIHYYALEYSTGFQLLDRAAIDMIRRANPVPAVPLDYPAGDMFEFLIPVSFYLQ